jgi:hypothetical protein
MELFGAEAVIMERIMELGGKKKFCAIKKIFNHVGVYGHLEERVTFF